MFCNCGPKEARALQLLAEVDRQEQEYKKLRQEKEQMHAPPWMPGRRATSAALWPSWESCWNSTATRRIPSIARAAPATRVSTTKCAPSTTR